MFCARMGEWAMKELDQLVLAYLKARSKNDIVDIAFYEIGQWCRISNRQAINIVNDLIKKKSLEFIGAVEGIGIGDYVVRYGIKNSI